MFHFARSKHAFKTSHLVIFSVMPNMILAIMAQLSRSGMWPTLSHFQNPGCTNRSDPLMTPDDAGYPWLCMESLFVF